MKRLSLLFIFLFVSISAFSWTVMYAEQYFKMYHQHFYQDPQDIDENIFYLRNALNSDFVNPLNALATIKDKKEWELYRYLFKMKCNLLILEEYRRKADKFDKEAAYFYNQPFRDIILKSLQVALYNYENSLAMWKDVVTWAEKANDKKFNFIYLEQIYKWQEDAYRIKTQELNYEVILNKDINRVKRVIKEFEEMNASTYSKIKFK